MATSQNKIYASLFPKKTMIIFGDIIDLVKEAISNSQANSILLHDLLLKMVTPGKLMVD